MEKLIYAADDEMNIRNLLKTFLEEAGYEVKIFKTGDLLYEEFLRRPSDLVILDVMMPGRDGIETCEEIRKISIVPIIILTAKETDLDYITGITAGGDEYLIKPFRPTVLLMSIKAILRRVEMEHKIEKNNREKDLEIGDLKYIKVEKKIISKEKDLKLTMTELRVLIYLMERFKKAISREELLYEVWGFNSEVETRVTDETIRRIRKKMSESNSKVKIQMVWGYGYKLVLEK